MRSNSCIAAYRKSSLLEPDEVQGTSEAPFAAHQAPASIRRWIISDDGYLTLDPNLKFAYSALIDAYLHRKTPPLNIGKLHVRKRLRMA